MQLCKFLGSIATMQVVLSVTVMLVDLSVAIMHVTVSVKIIQLEVCVALICKWKFLHPIWGENASCKMQVTVSVIAM